MVSRSCAFYNPNERHKSQSITSLVVREGSALLPFFCLSFIYIIMIIITSSVGPPAEVLSPGRQCLPGGPWGEAEG